MATLYDLDRPTLATLLDGQPRFRLDQLWDGLYRRRAPLESLTNVPAGLRAQLAAVAPTALHVVTERVADGGATTKWLCELTDGARIETVVMHYPDRSTVCVSTQAGCAMGCTFCATGQAGFERNLSVGEIVEQVLRASQHTPDRRIGNVVFMGMGEPLANYDRVWSAVERLHDDVGISARHLTVSTVGIVPGIRRLAHASLPVNLAVSLHAATDDLRDRLVPVNRRYPLAELHAACAEYVQASGRRLSLEWACMADVNDRPGDVDALVSFARPLRAHVNLIPLNPTPGSPAVGSDPASVRRLRDALVDRGVNATIRANRGASIDAACGQLRAAQRSADEDRQVPSR